jgi:hypothetical protein
MAEDNRLNLVEGTGINLVKGDQTLTINTTVNNVELTSPDNSINITSAYDAQTNTRTFNIDVNGGGESGENTVLESPNNSINITSAYDAQTNTRTFNIDVNGGGGTGEKIVLQSEDHSLKISDTYDYSSNTTTYDFAVNPQQSDWAETDSNSGTFIQHKPIEIFKTNDAYSAITTAVNAGKLAMTDRGHVYSKTDDNVHYFTKLNYVKNETYPTYVNKAMYEIVTVDEDNTWNTCTQNSSLISEEYLKDAFTGPIWDIYSFGGKEVYSVRLTQSPLYVYEHLEGQNRVQNLDAEGLSAITINNNKLTEVVNVNTSTLEILVPCATEGPGEHAPNFVVEMVPSANCIINVNKANLNHDGTIVGPEPLYYVGGSTSAAVSADIRYQLKGTGSYLSLTDYGPITTSE